MELSDLPPEFKMLSRIVAGETFTIVKPYVSEELLRWMRGLAREIWDEDRYGAN